MAERFPRQDSLKQIARTMRDQADQDAAFREPTGSATPDPGIQHEDRYLEVEWVGEPSMYRNPVVYNRLAFTGQEGGFTVHQAKVVRAANRMRTGRFPKVIREIPENQGFTRTYRWSKENGYVQRMLWQDVERLKASPDGHEFYVIGVDPDPRGPLALPLTGIKVVTDQEFKEIEAYVLDEREGTRSGG